MAVIGTAKDTQSKTSVEAALNEIPITAEAQFNAEIAPTAQDAILRATTAKVETMIADTQNTLSDQQKFISDQQKSMSGKMEKFTKGIEGLTSFGQGNIDAIVKSSEIAAKAAEGIGSEISSYSKKFFEDGVAAAQEIATAKTMTELFEKQTAFCQSAFEAMMQQTTKMNEIYSAAAKDISAPIGARMTAATEKLKAFSI